MSEATLYDVLKNKGKTWMPENLVSDKSDGWGRKPTGMQLEVLENDVFFTPDKNIVIHGPTSSGKTLLAETAALQQILDDSIEKHQVLYLVPLRVLVTSLCRQFQKDFENVKREGKNPRIFESSADYQDHDAQILSGDYDIAVVVYEKFFSMLNNPNHMLDSCGLIVVDELQMLSSPDRGPKMEFSIMKVLEIQREKQECSLRIIGLTTSESDVDALCTWLEADNLGNDIRPVPLVQHFVSYNSANMGRVEVFPTPDSGSSTSESDSKTNGDTYNCIIVPRVEASARRGPIENKNRCLFALLDKWMAADTAEKKKENEEDKKRKEKILIFNNSKRGSRFLAKSIAEKFPLFTPPEPDHASRRAELETMLNNALQEFNDEEDVKALGTFVHRGIAFHHSGLPSTVREAIEEDFRDENGRIQIIVCTETLMIGVNLPADVVVLYDGTVFRGSPKPLPLSLQEYKNFIGRAGRLGFSVAGKSYFLTDRLMSDKQRYTSDCKTRIVSPFKTDNAFEIAPYFMSWIGIGNAEMRIQEGLRQGFLCNKQKNEPAHITALSTSILDCLKRLSLKDGGGMQVSLVIERNHGLQISWHLSELGRALAPFALTLNTDAILIDYVIHNREELQIDGLQFKAPHTAQPVPPAPLLELLYVICQCSEVDQNPALQLPTDDTMIRSLNKSAKKYLCQVFPQKESSYVHANGSRPLAHLAHMMSLMEADELRAVTRAIVLALWMAGCSIRTIRESTNFNMSISTSDVERLSESVAYLMEALSKCQECLGMEDQDSKGMYVLSTSMKYGVPRSLVSLANTHARNVTRPFLLKIERRAENANKTPMEYVLASTEERYRTLQKALRERDHVHSYTQQVDNKSLDIPDQFRKLIPALRELDTNQNLDRGSIHQALKQFFVGLGENCQGNGQYVKISSDTTIIDSLLVQFSREGGTVNQIHFLVLKPSLDDEDTWENRIRTFTQKSEAERNGIPRRAITVLSGRPPAGEQNLPDDHLVISSEMLGILLLACLMEDSENTIQLILCILSDLKGAFILDGEGFFNAYGQIWELVKGYTRKGIDPHDTHPQLFYYPGIFDYENSIPSGERRQYTELPWGTEHIPDCPNRASFYHPAMQYSRMSENILENSQIIFCGAENLQEVKKFQTPIILENEADKGMDVVLRELANQLCSEPKGYQYDVGISFRGKYQAQMQRLQVALKGKGKNVLCMNTDTFKIQMAGDTLVGRLTEEFSKCRHIIACDTEDYDESLYTFTEYNVILDKLAYALKHRQMIPVYRVSIPGVLESQKLSDCFRHCYFDTYDDDKVDALADRLINQMSVVERRQSI